MNKIYTITKVACSAALLIALTACGNSGKDEASKVKGTGLPKAGVSTTGAPKIAYIEVNSGDRNDLIIGRIKDRYITTIESAFKEVLNDNFRVVIKKTSSYEDEEKKQFGTSHFIVAAGTFS